MTFDLVLVGCTKRKRDEPARARDLYDESPLFRRRRRVARESGKRWAILSAEHGLVDPDERLEPYDTHISDVETTPWATRVLARLSRQLDDGDRVLILAGGRDYVDPLVPWLENWGCSVETPLRSLPPGKQFNVLDDLLADEPAPTHGGEQA